jgi:hypothetical protein
LTIAVVLQLLRIGPDAGSLRAVVSELGPVPEVWGLQHRFDHELMSATLVMTGLGVQLAGLGQSCVNAECSAGECTRGVCCNRACDRTCQVCSAQGQCIDQSSQEACGNGAACFGVDNCKLPAGRACSQNGGDLQCGSGQCERRLGGTGPGDRICCLDDCGNSLQCNGQNRCQAPTAGAGQACGAPGQLQCQTGLSCVDGVCCLEACGGYCERCQAGSGTCVAVPAGQQEADPVSGNNCTNGFECTGTRNGCRARTGQPCSSTDGSDCVSGNCEATAGGARVCCSQDCSGVRDSCRANGQGCVECVGPGECANGCNIDQGTCNPPGALGDACSNGAQCLNGRCVDGVCCNSACTGQCESCASAGQPRHLRRGHDAPHALRWQRDDVRRPMRRLQPNELRLSRHYHVMRRWSPMHRQHVDDVRLQRGRHLRAVVLAMSVRLSRQRLLPLSSEALRQLAGQPRFRRISRWLVPEWNQYVQQRGCGRLQWLGLSSRDEHPERVLPVSERRCEYWRRDSSVRLPFQGAAAQRHRKLQFAGLRRPELHGRRRRQWGCRKCPSGRGGLGSGDGVPFRHVERCQRAAEL